VHGELGGNFPCALAIKQFAAVSDARVDLRPAQHGQEPVEHFEIEDMVEFVARRDRAVRQFNQSRRRQKLMSSNERVAALLHPVGRLVEAGPDGGR
jgi:hypothetical protein